MKSKLLLLIPLLAAGCAAPGHPTTAREVTTQGGKPPRCRVNEGDKEMSRAVNTARKTVGTFIAALQHPSATQQDFEVKKPFIRDGKVEHIWLSQVEYHGGHFHGKVDNKPEHLPDVKMGDRVSVNVNELTDWAFVDSGALVGGYTIRVLYRGLSPEAKKAFEAGANYHITQP